MATPQLRQIHVWWWFRLKRLCEYYGCFRRKKAWVRCMLLDFAFPRLLVIASHLFVETMIFIACDDANIGYRRREECVSLAKKRCTFDVATTFGNLDCKPLSRSHDCLEEEQIDASYVFEDFWTEVSLNDNMEMFYRSIMTVDPMLF
ncbi:hypothetical protein Plhal703r1_c06g0031021 [Plasmopara halstedii]